jgi:membrane associated rhomboid family serine protease
MKGLLLGILGLLVVWLVFGFFKGNFDPSALFTLIIGMVTGYSIGKKEKQTTYS